jgi:oligoendopeptidase F
MLFYRMLTEGKSGSPEELIKSFGWSKKDAQVQQDVQEFSCLFFDILERKVVVLDRMGCFGSVGELFCG